MRAYKCVLVYTIAVCWWVRYAWSEGGDSLLDSEEEEEERGESTHGRQPSPPAPPPDPLLPTARVQPSPSHRKPQVRGVGVVGVP